MITWDIRQGSPANYASTMSDVLVNGTVTNQSATSFWLTTVGHTIIFDGFFGIGASNTITGFHVYVGAQLLLDASGYSIDRDDIIDGNAAANGALIQLSYAHPVTINGSAGDDVVGGSTAGGSLFGNDGDDHLYGGFGNHLISGGEGFDVLIGDVGDHMGNGNDTVDYSDKTGDLVVTLSTTHATTVTLNGVAEDTIDEFENVNGGSGSDHITGSEVSNVLTGNGGNDILDGGAGADRLMGGSGDDTYVVDNFGDVVVEAAGQGNDTVLSSVSFTLGANVENLVLTGTGNTDATGNALANALSGNAAGNALYGGAGADWLSGGAGRDTLFGGADADTFVFDIKPAKKNTDKIGDFDVLDRIALDNDVFTKLKHDGALKDKFFAKGHADDGNDYIITRKNKVLYDPDGDGHKHAKLIAKLDDGPRLHADDFLVI